MFCKAARCFTGLLPVPVEANVSRLAIAEPSNQTVVTEILQELYQVNPQIFAQTIGETVLIQATFNIDATLCLPLNTTRLQGAKTVQALNHGIGFDKSYWNIAPGYSYVDATAAAGYATLAYNRLGVGNSDHPDALQIVQATTDVEIQHGVVQLLRTPGGPLGSFQHVIGSAHSYGAIIQLIQNAKYPKDVDAAVVTGFVNDLTSLPYAVLANNPAIAVQNDPLKTGNLSTSYLVHNTPISVQIAFWRFPYFDSAIFNKQYAAKQTYTIGRFFTLAGIYGPAPGFTGPVDIVVGHYDFTFCHGDCTYPTDQAAATLKSLYPAASNGSQTHIVPESGHAISAHYGAQMQFDQINRFLRSDAF
ncbi:hypothetical protein BDR22DRAFT_960594 [Usnea florida]